MKVRASVKPICSKCKVIRRRGVGGLFVRTRSISNDRVNFLKEKQWRE